MLGLLGGAGCTGASDLGVSEGAVRIVPVSGLAHQQTRAQLDLPLRTWVSRPAPGVGQGPMPEGTGKHARLIFDSKRGRMVLAGGDYMYTEPGIDTAENYSGMQMVWQIDLGQGERATWGRLKSWCAPRDEVQPGRPDTVVWVYDSKRDQGVMMPGFYFMTQSGTPTVCPGVNQVNDSVLFNFQTNTWSLPSYGPPPNGYGGDEGGSFGVYDPVTDAVYRFRRMGYNGMEILFRGRNTWEQIPLGGSGSGIGETNANRDQSAVDVQGRSIYVISWRTRSLMRYSIAAKRVVETTPMPPQWVPPDAPGDHETWLVFDPINRVILNPVARDFDGVLVGLGIFHVDTKKWEWEDAPTSSPKVSGNVLGFDAEHNCLMFLGRSDAHVWWLYRYGNGPRASAGSPRPPIVRISTSMPSEPRPAEDPAAVGRLSALPDNSWLSLNPKPRTVSQAAANSQNANAPDLRRRTIVSGEPVTRSYSGLAYGDGRVFNFGGGHSTHPGNNVDLYVVGANQWTDQYPPEVPANGSPEARTIAGAGSAVANLTPLGRPYTQHTYQQSAYDPQRKRFLIVLPSGTWSWSPSTKGWTLLAGPSKGSFSPNWQLSHGNVVYDPHEDVLLAFVTAPQGSATTRGTYRFDPKSNTWSYAGALPSRQDFSYKELYSSYDPDRREVAIVVGESRLFRYRPASNTWTEVTSFPAALSGVLPNFAYDTKSKVMVFLVTPLFQGDDGKEKERHTQIWVWDPERDTWSSPSTPPGAPEPILYAGKERGCFVYDPMSNVFIFLRTVEQYCNIEGGYECGGTTKTWAYRYRR
jgi:hypothetical protein